MSVPILTKAEDVHKLVDYLKTKSTGATSKEIGAALGKKLVDPRKLSAYETWGLVSKNGDSFLLTSLGKKMARKPKSERVEIFQKILISIIPYKGALEWLYHQSLDSVTAAEIGAHWFENYKSEIGKPGETTLGNMAVCFMNVCSAAEVGTLTVGRKGKPTRLDLNQDSLKSFITQTSNKELDNKDSIEDDDNDIEDIPTEDEDPKETEKEKPKPIFIAHGKNKGPLNQLKKILDDFKIPYKVAGDEPNAGKLIPEKIKELMRECGSAIFIFTGNEGKSFTDQKGQIEPERQVPNLNVVFELGAASILYNDRVIIFKEDNVEFASDFSSIGYISFETGNIQSKTGDLIKELVVLGFIKITTAG